MKIAAFDLGKNLAVAHNGYGPDAVRVNHVTFDGTRQERAAKTFLWLVEFFATAEVHFGGFDAVFYERPFARGHAATRCLWGIAGLIEATAQAAGCAVLDATPAEIKKHATGNPKADKDDMILMAQVTGYEGDNEHEADAWNALRMAEATLTKG